MAQQTPDSVAAANAAGAALEAAARARDAEDAALADALMGGAPGDGDAPTPNVPLLDALKPATAPGRTPRPDFRYGGDDKGDLQTDDFGLDGDLRSVMERSLEAAFADDLAKDTPDSPADTAATPAPAPDASSAPTQGQPTEGGAGGGGAAAPGAAPGDATSPPAPTDSSAAGDFSLDAYARDYFGTNLDRDTAAHLFSVLGNLQSASPEQRQQIDAILAGRGIPQLPQHQQPALPDPAAGVGPAQPAPAAPPVPAYLPPRPPDTDYEAQRVYDTVVLPAFQAQQQQLDAIRADIARTTTAQQQAQQAAAEQRINAASSAWRNDHPILSDGEFDALTNEVVRSGTFPALIAKHGGDIDAATRAIYEQHFWTNPALRDRAMANAASGRDPMTSLPDAASAVAEQQRAVEEGRRALAASVAGGGGQPTQRAPSAPRNKDERKAAMVGEIAAAMEPTT